MSRYLLSCLLFAACLCAPAAEETSLTSTVTAIRSEAESALASQRAQIAKERAALMAHLQDAHRTAATARQRLDAAYREHEQLTQTWERREREQDQAVATLRSLADRAVIGARLDPEAAAAVARAEPPVRVAAAIAATHSRLDAVAGRLARRFDEEAIIARDGALRTVPVLRLGEARAVAVGSDDATRGLLIRTDDGAAWRVAGPTLPDAVRGPALPTAVLLDPDGSIAAAPTLEHWSLRAWLAAGRFFIWPIVAVLVIGLLVSLERVITLTRLHVPPHRLLRLATLLRQGNTSAVAADVEGGRTPLDRIVAVGLAYRDRSRDAREAAIDQALLAEAPRFQRGLGTILVMAGIAPLLGLLGTVTGMIDMFAVIAQQGSGSAKSLSGAISEALVCTQAGMIAAIPLLLLHAALNRIADRRLMLLEEAACAVLGFDSGTTPTPVAAGDATLARA